jgi:hypothetical protein
LLLTCSSFSKDKNLLTWLKAETSCNVNNINRYGESALTLAVKRDLVETVHFLLKEMDCNPYIVNNHCEPLLVIARRNQFREEMFVMLENAYEKRKKRCTLSSSRFCRESGSWCFNACMISCLGVSSCVAATVLCAPVTVVAAVCCPFVTLYKHPEALTRRFCFKEDHIYFCHECSSCFERSIENLAVILCFPIAAVLPLCEIPVSYCSSLSIPCSRCDPLDLASCMLCFPFSCCSCVCTCLHSMQSRKERCQITDSVIESK